MPRYSLRTTATLLIVLIIGSGCSSDSSDGGLGGISLSSDTVEELDMLCLDGIDASRDLSNLELIMTADGLDEPVSLRLFEDEGVIYTPAPLHPVTPGEGGVVRLRLTDGDDDGPTLTLDLTPLPKAPGAWQETIDAMKSELAERATQAGSSYEELAAASVEGLSSELLALKLVQGYVDDGTDGDLESLVTSADLSLTDAEQGLIDAVVSKLGMVDLIPGSSSSSRRGGCIPSGEASAEALRRPGDLSGSKADVDSESSPPSPRNRVSSFAPPRAASALLQTGACRVSDISISGGADLARKVALGVDATVVENGAEEQVLASIGSAASLGQSLPGQYGELVSVLNAIFGAVQFWYQLDAAIYPTSFESLTTSPTITRFNEDFETWGAIEDTKVVATSRGFNLTSQVNAIVDHLTGMGVGALAGDDAGLAGIALSPGSSLRQALTAELIERYGGEYFDYCPGRWEIPINHADFIDVDAVIGRFTENKSALEYAPDVAKCEDALGEDRIRVRAKSEVFAGLTAETVVLVEAVPIRVIVTPDLIEVENPGQVFSIDAQIQNADDTKLDWNPGNGEWADSAGPETPGSASRPLQTPSNVNSYHFFAVIESKSKSGLRADSCAPTPRNDSVEVKLKDFTVSPDPGTVRVGGELEFMATGRDGEPYAVVWRATGGTIESIDAAGITSGVGVYVAGDVPGTYTVTATSILNPGSEVTVTVEVTDECDPVGNWRVREQDFLTQISAFDPAVTMTHVSGEWYGSFYGGPEEGQFIEDFNAWTFRSTTSAGNLLTTLSGTRTGMWELRPDGASIKITTTESAMDVTLVLEATGQQLPGSGDLELGGLGESSAPFTCTGNVRTATVTDSRGTLTMTADKLS